MGRYYLDKKNTVEDCTCLSLPKLKEFDLLKGYCSTTLIWTRTFSGHKSNIGILVNVLDEPYIKLRYTITDRDGNKADYDYKVAMTTTQCNFSGRRYWFICPLNVNGVFCGRRVARLYLSSGGKYFGCRHCYNLSYNTRNECHLGRFGKIGYFLRAERQMEELQGQIKRRTWRGIPTRKARKLDALERKIEILAPQAMAQLDNL